MPTNIPLLHQQDRCNQQFISTQIADESLLIPVTSQLTGDNPLFVLNEMGAWTWELTDNGRSLKQVRLELSDEEIVCIPDEIHEEGCLELTLDQEKR